MNKTGTAAANKLTGTNLADRLYGLGGNDQLFGLGGNDTLDGGTGNDTLTGGTGNDFYKVDSLSDKIVETATGGTADTISASITYSLATTANRYVENLVLTGSALKGTGNDLGNTITGNAQANTLSGGKGNDRLSGGDGSDTLDGGVGNDTLDGGGTGFDSLNGGAGNDTYIVDAAGKAIADSAGTDLVRTSVSNYILIGTLENLELTGTLGINGTGNALANKLTGNSGNNRLDGKAGDDKLSGGDGNDSLSGGDDNDSLSGGAGIDTLDGGNGVDTLLGGDGNDVLVWDAGDAVRDGGLDEDTLRVKTNGAVNLGAALSHMEAVDLDGNNTLTVSAADIQAHFSGATVRVDGEAGDAVLAGAGWTRLANDGGYAVYGQGGATLEVDLDVDRDGVGVASVNLGILDGTSGARVDGFKEDGGLGNSVSRVGDFNGDGFEDFILGARHVTAVDYAGASYVVLGGAAGVPDGLNVSALDGTNGFRLTAAAVPDQLGYSVSSAGDVNGDGLADLVVGAWYAGPSYAGASYVIFGAASGLGSSLGMSMLDGTNGFAIHGAASGDFSGNAVAAAGDVNGDGYGDLLVGSYWADPNGDKSGAAYVVFGKAGGFASSISLTAIDGTNGFRISGETALDYAGASVSAAGDVNGDGLADVIVGAPKSGSGYGAAFVVFGREGSVASSLELSALDGTNGFKLTGTLSEFSAGTGVSAADLNGDGLSDLVVGAPGGDGAVYVVYGRTSGFAPNIDLSSLDGASGSRLGAVTGGDRGGERVALAGDLNGDGYDDLVIGAKSTGGVGVASGASYVVLGKAGGFGASLELSSLDGFNGFQLAGAAAGDRAGIAVSAAGDVNGDGYADLLVGADGAGAGSDYGAAYILYGRDFGNTVEFTGTAGANTLAGTAAAESFVAGQGDDTMTGGGGADVFRGGEGDDRIVVASAGFADVDGGTGADTLAVSGSGISLDLTALSDLRVTGIEIVDIGAGGHTLTLDVLEVLNLSDTSNTLRVRGTAGTLESGGGWTFDTFLDDGGATYLQYTQGAAVLQLEAGGIGSDLLDGDIVGTSGADSLTGTVDGDRLLGFGGNDTLDGGDGGDVVLGFAGSDKILGGLGDDTLDGGADGDSIAGGAGDDQVAGAAGVDTLDGGDDADTVDGGAGADIVAGGNGNDVLIWDASDTSVNGGADSDTLRVAGGAVELDLTADGVSTVANIEAVDLAGTGDNVLVLNAAGIAEVTGATTLLVNGDAGDRIVVNDAGWSDDGSADGIHTYTSGGTTLQVQDAVEVVLLGNDPLFTDGSFSYTSDFNYPEDGFRVRGETSYDQAGRAIAAGDINGDGFDDFIVSAAYLGAPDLSTVDPDDEMEIGRVYVFFGPTDAGLDRNLDLSAIDGTNGIRIDGFEDAGLTSLATGDVNGDGLDDIVIGSDGAAAGAVDGAGAVYVVFGTATGFASALDLSTLDGDNGFTLHGVQSHGHAGSSVATGDIDGDGYDDLLVGAPNEEWEGPEGPSTQHGYGGEGIAYLVKGRADWSASQTLPDAGDRLLGTGATTHTDTTGWSTGNAVALVDMNGDGRDDLAIGASFGDAGAVNAAGLVYRVSGGNVTDGFFLQPANIKIRGESALSNAGYSLANGGDINGDGIDDLIIGAIGSDAAYVVFGGGIGPLELSALNGANGFQLTGGEDLFRDGLGGGVGGAGDINGDGYGDFLVGAPLTGELSFNKGEAYVVFGRAGWDATFDLGSLNGANGLTFTAQNTDGRLGNALAGLGDLNGDGYDDIAFGSPLASPSSVEKGFAYVLYGRDFNGAVDFAGTDGDDTMAGSASADSFVAGLGADTLTGDGGADAFHGGAGDDVIEVGDAGFLLVDGGSGSDTLRLSGPGFELDLTAVGDSRIAGIEKIDMAGEGDFDLVIAKSDVLAALDAGHELTVDGDVGDTVALEGAWAVGNDLGDFTEYTSGTVRLLINNDIAVELPV